MARLSRLVLMLAAGFGFALAAPSTGRAGVIPWIYDAIFGPVGSLRGNSGYAPMNASYGYAPYQGNYGSYGSAGYTPMSSAYGAYGSQGSGCSSCNQSSYYVPSTGYESPYGNSSGFFGSPSGNSCASSGTNCTNCSVNSTPTTSGYGATGAGGPTPDPNYNSRELNHRLNELEHRLNEDERFLKNKHNNDFSPRPYAPNTYGTNRDREEVVPSRKNSTFGSDPSDPNFPPPRKTRGAPPNEPDESLDTRKPTINPPSDDGTKSGGTKDDGSATINEAEPLTRLDNRVTSRAIAPRERLRIVTNQTKTALAKSTGKSLKNRSGNPRPPELARH